MVELCESTKLEAQFKAHHATRTISLGADFQLMSKWSLFFPATADPAGVRIWYEENWEINFLHTERRAFIKPDIYNFMPMCVRVCCLFRCTVARCVALRSVALR